MKPAIRVENLSSGSGGARTGRFSVGEPIEISVTMESDISVLGEEGYTVKAGEGMPLFTSSNDQGRLRPSPTNTILQGACTA